MTNRQSQEQDKISTENFQSTRKGKRKENFRIKFLSIKKGWNDRKVYEK